ncbi:MAG: polysaccharide biosynthesis protein [Desulfobulbaceae bacterium A2]|nr:MAG: polysaccharide biosynthesis protein [Desulfobulbaceae bacterium A2]
MSLKKNIIANYFGQGWTALMGLAFIPVYIKYMGIEAYGLIGIFALLQAWLMLLDMGMTPALSREMARFTGGAHNAQSIRDLLRSIEIIGFFVAVLAALGIWAASEWLASDWLKAEKLPVDVVAKAFTIMGVVMALRFIENIYRSSLVGLQKQVILNVVTSGMATLRGLGAVSVLVWVAPAIDAFFVWQGIVSVVTVAIFAVILYRALPASPQGGRFSWSAIINIWRFAAGIMVITLLSFFLMQTDKILLSRLLTLEHFGYYALAAMVANSLYMLVTPIDQAFFPRFTALAAREDQPSLTSTYHLGSQLITVFVAAPAIVLIVFGDIVLTLWTRDAALAQRITPLLAILSLGTLFNCFMHMPYQLQLAHGWTRLTICVNIIAVLLLVPAIFWVAPKYGAVGVAWVWVILNASYILFAVHFMFRRLLTTEKWRWYRQDIAIPLIAAAVTAGIARWSIPNNAGALGQFVVLLLSSGLTSVAAALTAPLVRQQLYIYATRIAKPYFVRKN